MTPNIEAFVEANKLSPVVRTELASRRLGGAIFTLQSGATFRLDAMEIAVLPAGTPRVTDAGATIEVPPINPSTEELPVPVPDTKDDYS